MGGCSELVRGCLASEDEEGPACLILPGVLIWEVQVRYRALTEAAWPLRMRRGRPVSSYLASLSGRFRYGTGLSPRQLYRACGKILFRYSRLHSMKKKNT
jgi:hypothetical protein